MFDAFENNESVFPYENGADYNNIYQRFSLINQIDSCSTQ
jgi:hypothetical protein